MARAMDFYAGESGLIYPGPMKMDFRSSDDLLRLNIRIHHLAEVEAGARIGRDTTIWRWVHVASTARIGEGVSIGERCYIAGSVGNYSRIGNGVEVWEEVSICSRVFVGPNVTFTNCRFPSVRCDGLREKTMVWDDAIIGAGSCLLPVTVGMSSLIGTGSVVTKDVPARETWVGNPASKLTKE